MLYIERRNTRGRMGHNSISETVYMPCIIQYPVSRVYLIEGITGHRGLFFNERDQRRQVKSLHDNPEVTLTQNNICVQCRNYQVHICNLIQPSLGLMAYGSRRPIWVQLLTPRKRTQYLSLPSIRRH